MAIKTPANRPMPDILANSNNLRRKQTVPAAALSHGSTKEMFSQYVPELRAEIFAPTMERLAANIALRLRLSKKFSTINSAFCGTDNV